MFLQMLAALALTQSPGCPKTSPDQPPPISAEPDWLSMPDPDALYWAYPARALAERVEGRAVIQCDVSIQGVAENCTTTFEDPKSYGFGAATISVMSKMLFRPKVQCGVVVPGQIRIPLNFKLPPDRTISTATLDPNDKKLALAGQLIEALHSAEGLKALIEDSAYQAITQEDTKRTVPPEERKAVDQAATESWAAAKAEFINALARVLAERLSEMELQQLLDFYRSPAGSKFVEITPTLNDDIQAIFDQLEPEVMTAFHQHYCEKMQARCTLPDAL